MKFFCAYCGRSYSHCLTEGVSHHPASTQLSVRHTVHLYICSQQERTVCPCALPFSALEEEADVRESFK